jgi:hypothetical protein
MGPADNAAGGAAEAKRRNLRTVWSVGAKSTLPCFGRCFAGSLAGRPPGAQENSFILDLCATVCARDGGFAFDPRVARSLLILEKAGRIRDFADSYTNRPGS